MSTRIVVGDEIEIRADWAQAASPIQWRCGDWCDDDDPRREWQSTPYQVADTSRDETSALELVDAWVEAQS